MTLEHHHMTHHQTTHQHLKREQGGALLVSIIMIFMMSILGVSAMRGSTIERRMADNSVFTNKNFQVAESSTEVSLNDVDNLKRAAANDGQAIRVQTTVQAGNAVNSWADVTYIGDSGTMQGWSGGEGTPGTFNAARFVTRGNSESTSARADSEIHQGAMLPIPAN